MFGFKKDVKYNQKDIIDTDFKREYVVSALEDIFSSESYKRILEFSRFLHFMSFKTQGCVVKNYVVTNVLDYIQLRVIKDGNDFFLRIDSSIKDLKFNEGHVDVSVDFDKECFISQHFPYLELFFLHDANKDTDKYSIPVGDYNYELVKYIFSTIKCNFSVGNNKKSGTITVKHDLNDITGINFDYNSLCLNYKTEKIGEARNKPVFEASKDFIFWCNKYKLTGVSISYVFDLKGQIHITHVESDKPISILKIPQGVVELAGQFRCDSLVISERDSFMLSGDMINKMNIRNVVCEADNLVLTKGCFSGTDIESFKCKNVSLNNGAFQNCESLSVFDCDNISFIGHFCFSSCKSLKSFEFDKVKCEHIGIYAFQNCHGLQSIDLSVIPVLTLGEGCFMSCTNLKYVNMSLLVTLSDHVFKGCTSLEKVDFYKVRRFRDSLGIFNNCGDRDIKLVFDKQEFDTFMSSFAYDERQKSLGVLFGKAKSKNAVFAISKVEFRD